MFENSCIKMVYRGIKVTKMRVVVFGVGGFYRKRKTVFDGVDVVCYLDNNYAGDALAELNVLAPEFICEYKYDVVVIMTDRFLDEITKQLLQLGCPKEKILSYNEFVSLMQQMGEKQCCMKIYYGADNQQNGSGKKVLLVSHDLSLTGAPIVLFYAAVNMKKMGYDVFVLSAFDGKLRERYTKQGITVFIDDSIIVGNIWLNRFLEYFDCCMVNTVTLHRLVECLDSLSIPTIWWLHEGEDIYNVEKIDAREKNAFRNISVYGVGRVACNTYRHYYHGNCKSLLYGIPNEESNRMIIKDGKVRLAMVGAIQKRKGQDILLDALSYISPEERRSMEVYIVGSTLVERNYADMIKKRAEDFSEVIMLDEMNHHDINDIYEKIDILVCTSREDPMPVVITEAFSKGIPCIVSTQTGSSEYITDGVNGFLVEPNPRLVANKITAIMKMDKEEIEKIGKKGYEIYRDKFSLPVFYSNLNVALCNLLD
ncbi:glycosyltransferase family 4 protein [Pseudobutyrivibrio sp. C4]|uniref:glycosyltransferase family 4 protein n=1 Tax=Pseudobutyrivibrio sp. C4 TaxID=1520803 RepID=UPI000B831C34|nr:glycosyltransferase family 4 protein [Pseudobutyrivibrio sp. C4]